jgi:hypothetical protein
LIIDSAIAFAVSLLALIGMVVGSLMKVRQWQRADVTNIVRGEIQPLSDSLEARGRQQMEDTRKLAEQLTGIARQTETIQVQTAQIDARVTRVEAHVDDLRIAVFKPDAKDATA